LTGPRRVGVLFGGRSVEHEVSVDSARSVAGALAEGDLVCVPIGVTGDGRWLSPELSRTLLDGGGRRAEPSPEQDDGARVIVDPGAGRLLCGAEGRAPEPVELDVVFPLVHGWGGEDGRLQGTLDLAGIPCVGAGVAGSAVGMDKALARQLFEAQGLPGVRWMAFHEASYGRGRDAAHRRIASELGFPVFVKPARGGSSVGVSRVSSERDLPAAMDEAFDCDGTVVVEQGIDAREIECAVLGNERPEASVLGEIVPSRDFYDYAAKYIDGTSELKIPAPLDPETAGAVRGNAVAAFRCLGLHGMARVDFLLDRASGQVFLNEVNTLPGFTSISMFPKLWGASGLAYPRLVERLVDLALERWKTERAHRTAWKPD
jgi:D-alanine-D-alanine ligase